MKILFLIILSPVFTLSASFSRNEPTQPSSVTGADKSAQLQTSAIKKLKLALMAAETTAPEANTPDSGDTLSEKSVQDDTAPAEKKEPTTTGTASGKTTAETAELLALRMNLRRCLAFYLQRPTRSSRLCPWEIMHCALGFGVDTPLVSGGEQYNAIAWLCENLQCQGKRLLYTKRGYLHVRKGPGCQGHAGQFLAILAQSRVNRDYPLIVDSQRLTVADLIEYEKQTCRGKSELSFQLIGLSHYLDTEAQWENDRKEKWDIPRMIKEELSQPVVGASCGGTHRMMAFSYVVKKRAASGKPITGQWHRAKVYVDDFHKYTLNLQNEDGSLSTAWFRAPQDSSNIARKLATTGHILEWLVYSLPPEDLADQRVVKSVVYLTDLLWENRHRNWKIGPLAHGIHALCMYDENVFGGRPGRRAEQLAEVVAADTKRQR